MAGGPPRTRVLVELEALGRELGAPVDLVRRLVRNGLVVPLGKSESGARWVEVDARRQIERVRSLIAAGYAEKDIAVVIGKVERPEADPGKRHILSLATFARLTQTPEELLVRWVQDGLIEAFGATERGELLFTAETRGAVRLLVALDHLGLAVLAPDLTRALAPTRSRPLDPDGARALVETMKRRMAQTKAALATLEAALPAIEKHLAPRSRRLLSRKKVGTTRAPRGRTP